MPPAVLPVDAAVLSSSYKSHPSIVGDTRSALLLGILEATGLTRLDAVLLEEEEECKGWKPSTLLVPNRHAKKKALSSN